jgi:hypothetical protein
MLAKANKGYIFVDFAVGDRTVNVAVDTVDFMDM